MNDAKTNKIRLGCEIALGVISLVIAIVFITQVADIYYSGGERDYIYSRAVVWSRLKYLIAPVCVWIAAVIACFVLSVLFPRAEKKQTVSDAERVRRLRRRISYGGDAEYKQAKAKYSSLELGRYIIYGAASAFAVGVGIYTIVYLCSHSNFTSGAINDDILNLVKNVFPFIIASFILFVAAVIYEHFTAKAELDDMKKLLVLCKGKPISRSPLALRMERIKSCFEKRENIIVTATRIAVALVAVVFIGIGIWDGGAGDVLDKAVKICTECIGLG